MKTHPPLTLLLTSLAALGWLLAGAGCAGGGGSAIPSSGTPVNPWANPAGADFPTAPLTGAQSRYDPRYR